MAPQLEWLDAAATWMGKADSDLASASILIEGDRKHLDTGSYHCQQAAEKALKAWLTANGAIFPKLTSWRNCWTCAFLSRLPSNDSETTPDS